MRRNSFNETSILTSENDSVKQLYFPQKNVKYTFNDIYIDNFPFINYSLLFLNILGIIILYFSYFYGYFSVLNIKGQNHIINQIFIFVSIFLFFTLIKNILVIFNNEENIQKIIVTQFSVKYTFAFYLLSLYFLTYYLIPNGNNVKSICLVCFSMINLILLLFSYYNFKEKEKNIIYQNIFDVISLSFSLSLYTSFSFIISINTFVILYNNLLFVYICLLISVIVITYYYDFTFSGLCIVYEMSFVRQFSFNDIIFICFILNSFCFVVSILSKIKNEEKLFFITFISRNDNSKEEEKYFENDSLLEAYNKQNNYYDSL